MWWTKTVLSKLNWKAQCWIFLCSGQARGTFCCSFFFCILIDKCVWNQFETIATQPDWSSNQELFFVYLTSYKKKQKNRDITDGDYGIVACVIRNQMVKKGIKGMTSWHFNLHCSMVNSLFIIYMHFHTLDYFYTFGPDYLSVSLTKT